MSKDVHPMVLQHGWPGYAYANLEEPTETEWGRHLEEALAKHGYSFPAVLSSGMSSGMPDRVLLGNCGNALMELKGPRTPIRLNQVLTAKMYNTRSFYGCGKVACIAYQAPNVLGILKQDRVEEFARVDMLNINDFNSTAGTLAALINIVKEGDTIDDLNEHIELLGIDKPGPPQSYFILPMIELAETVDPQVVISYTRSLALIQGVGQTLPHVITANTPAYIALELSILDNRTLSDVVEEFVRPYLPDFGDTT